MKQELAKLALNNGLLDYLTLYNNFISYRNPRDKISRLIKEGSIIRVKKGLYILNSAKLIRKEVLANLIYGPSYISLHYALSYYGMIPERVETITCITTKKSKTFTTPIGLFSYQHVSLLSYSCGVCIEKLSDDGHFFIATKEKALCDLVASVNTIKNIATMKTFLLEDMRIDKNKLIKLTKKLINEIALTYKNNNVNLLVATLKEIK